MDDEQLIGRFNAECDMILKFNNIKIRRKNLRNIELVRLMYFSIDYFFLSL